jgi:hypothetical protein
VTAGPRSNGADRNRYQYFPVSEPVFDRAAFDAADRVVRGRRADDTTILVQGAPGAADDGAVADDLVSRAIDVVAAKAIAAGATRLVVVAPVVRPPCWRRAKATSARGTWPAWAFT